MSLYETIKIIHILSACILFGTGIGIAFFMLCGYLSKDKSAFVVVSRKVVLADWLFTAPAVLIQLVTGLWLVHALGVSYRSTWFISVLTLFMLVGLCWLPVVWIQIRLARIAGSDLNGIQSRRLMLAWVILGALAFLIMIVIFYLMVTKVGMGT